MAPVRTEHLDGGAIARIVLARPEVHNAQDLDLLYGVNDAFDAAARDDDVRVILLAAEGRNFSAGHDLVADWSMDGRTPVGTACSFGRPGVDGYMAFEEEAFLELSERWRNIPKPVVAEVRGKAIAGGLMLVWAADLIVASETAEFRDPVVALGVNGGEWFMHPWEVGARAAKEMLFTGRALTAQDAWRLGMVSRVVADDELEGAALDLARVIADQPPFAVKLAKQAVNQAVDAQGRPAALRAAFALHQLGHAHNNEVHGTRFDPDGPARIRGRRS